MQAVRDFRAPFTDSQHWFSSIRDKTEISRVGNDMLLVSDYCCTSTICKWTLKSDTSCGLLYIIKIYIT